MTSQEVNPEIQSDLKDMFSPMHLGRWASMVVQRL